MQIPGFTSVSKSKIEYFYQFGFRDSIVNPNGSFNTVFQIPSLPIPTADVYNRIVRIPKVVDSRMLKESPENTDDGNILTDTGNSRSNSAVSPDDKIHLNAGSRSNIEFSNNLQIINLGVELARQAFGERPGFVLGDIGPFGGLMEPHGDIPEQRVREAFAEQAEALVAAGVDAIIVETQTALEELGIGIEAAKKAGAPCVIGSMAYDVTRDGSKLRTMMGISPEQGAAFMRGAGVDIVALNCGTAVDVGWAARAVKLYQQVCDLPTMAQPNAGQPVLEHMKVVYKQTAEDMVAELPTLLETGVNIVGGCCGSTPDHIRAFRKIIDERGNSR